MADQSDVETLLTTLVTQALYPSGVTGSSVVGTTCRVYRGWPSATGLDSDLANGIVNVTVFPDAARQRNTTRWPDEWVQTATVTPTMSITVSGTAASVTGTPSAGMLVGLRADLVSVVYKTTASDTPELVAAQLAADLVAAGRIAVANGAVVTVPGAGFVLGRVMAMQPAMRQTKRQRQGFRVSLWCPTPALRDAAGAVVDGALAAQDFITLPDTSTGRLRFLSSVLYDQSLNARLYRRDLLYGVDYATTITQSLPEMVFGVSGICANGATIEAGILC